MGICGIGAHRRAAWVAACLPVFGLFVRPGTARAAAVTFSASGPDAASITSTRDAFRTAIGGGTTPGVPPGSFGGVRREINWDATPAGFSAPNNLPANFFNVNSPRGVVFSGPGTGFQVSSATTDTGTGQPAAANFGNINPNYTATFQPFSTQRLFTALGSNITDVNFFLAGTSFPATVNAFGVVFSDVDTTNTTSLQFFGPSNNSLGTFFAPASAASNQGLSFLGVRFNAGEQVSRVRITSGNAPLGTGINDQNGDLNDLVVMDDFIYSEPIPEPSALGLGSVAALGLLARRRRARGR